MPGFVELGLSCIKLKEVKRTGWVRTGVLDPESVADHSYNIALLVLLASRYVKDLDVNRMLKMALLHDLDETITGDIVNERGTKKIKSSLEKKEAEQKAFESIFIGEHWLTELYDEFIWQKTEEAKFLKQLEKLETAFQALRYEQTNPDISASGFDEFWQNTKMHVKHPFLKEQLEMLVKMRNQR